MTLYTAGLDATDWQLLRSRWRWLLGAGILLALVALVALFNLLIATVVSVLFVGVTMLLAGAARSIVSPCQAFCRHAFFAPPQ